MNEKDIDYTNIKTFFYDKFLPKANLDEVVLLLKLIQKFPDIKSLFTKLTFFRYFFVGENFDEAQIKGIFPEWQIKRYEGSINNPAKNYLYTVTDSEFLFYVNFIVETPGLEHIENSEVFMDCLLVNIETKARDYEIEFGFPLSLCGIDCFQMLLLMAEEARKDKKMFEDLKNANFVKLYARKEQGVGVMKEIIKNCTKRRMPFI